MKTIIIRKPKFMRNDTMMHIYIDVANVINEQACNPDLTPDQRYYFVRRMGECLNKAAKAGGFLRTKDFIRWMELHKDH